MALQREDGVWPCIYKAYKKLGDIFKEEENLWTLPHSGLGMISVTWYLSVIRVTACWVSPALRWVTMRWLQWLLWDGNGCKKGKTARLITEINLKLRHNASGCAGCFPGLVSEGNYFQSILQLSKCNLWEPTPSLGLHLAVTSYSLGWVLSLMNLLGISGSLTSPLLLFSSFMWVYTVIFWQTKCKGNIVWLDQNKTTQKLFWMQMIPFQLTFLSMRLGFTQHLSLSHAM